jgi:transposase
MKSATPTSTPTPPVMYVGIDVAKEQLVCAQLVQGILTPLPDVPNTETGFQGLADHLEAAQPAQRWTIRLVVEPTGGYELRLITWAHTRGWQIVVVNSKQVRDWVKGQGQRAKTDALDAQMLARFAAERPENKPLPLWQPLPETLTRLDSLVARRRELEQMLQQERNRQSMYAGRPGLAVAVVTSVTAITVALTASLAEIDQTIQDLLDQDSDMQEQIDQLDSIPGVGDKTVLPLFVLLARWHALTGGRGSDKALAAFVGLDAQTNQSGQRTRRGGISKTGDPEMRRLLFMAALGGKRKQGDNPLRRFYERLVGRGKLRMVALVAAARKILMWAWAIFRSHTYFDPQKHAQGA